MSSKFDIVILGLTITSSWGNGHATTYRSLIKGLAQLGYRVLFLERDMPWYAANRDNAEPYGATTLLYQSFEDLTEAYESVVAKAGLVMVGSYVPDGIRVGDWVCSVARGSTAFYDIDTPVTVKLLEEGRCEYINRALIKSFGAYFSFSGGPLLERLESEFGSPMARALYCSVDTDLYVPSKQSAEWELGYLGTYSEDRQAGLHTLLCEPAEMLPEKRFVVGGPQYPDGIFWPGNVERMVHVPPAEHPSFYGRQRFTLNLTRTAMKEAGHSPSVRLFEAATCQVPIISDWWDGLDSFFLPEKEILLATNADDVCRFLIEVKESERQKIAASAQARILAEHTPKRRAWQLAGYWNEIEDGQIAKECKGQMAAL